MSILKGLMGLAGLVQAGAAVKNSLGQLGGARVMSQGQRGGLGDMPASQMAPSARAEAVRRAAGLPPPPMRMKMGRVATLSERLHYIQQCVLLGMRDPRVIAQSRKILTGKQNGKWLVPEYDNLAELKAIYAWIDDRIRYTSDPYNMDTFASPWRIIEMEAGDCDDFATLTCALVLCVGIPAKLIVIQTKGSSSPNHIFAAAGLPRSGPTKWYGMDASTDKDFGWVAPPSAVDKAWDFKPLPG